MRSWEPGAHASFHSGVPAESVDALRASWRGASLGSGWPFPSDWGLPEVDRVCVAAVGGRDLVPPLRRLAAARARAGAGLAETLSDLAALHAVLDCPDATDGGLGLVGVDPDAPPTSLVRPVALAWADVAVGGRDHGAVSDGLTGLATAAYLRMRLAEVYGRAARGGTLPVLVRFHLDLTAATGWSRLVSMVLLADVLRSTFDTGETLAGLTPSVAAVLAGDAAGLRARSGHVSRLAGERLRADPHLRDTDGPHVSFHTLPGTHAEACVLLDRLASGRDS